MCYLPPTVVVVTFGYIGVLYTGPKAGSKQKVHIELQNATARLSETMGEYVAATAILVLCHLARGYSPTRSSRIVLVQKKQTVMDVEASEAHLKCTRFAPNCIDGQLLISLYNQVDLTSQAGFIYSDHTIDLLPHQLAMFSTPVARSSHVATNPQLFAALNSIHCCENSGLVVPHASLSIMQS
jgi:hypothetical protein